MVKLLVLYIFHLYNDRVKHFLDNSIFYDENIDFVIICNDKSINIDDEIIHYNTTVFYRDNIGYDFGGWSDALFANDIYKNYTHFIFVNSSVMGPYLDPNYTGRWTDIYIENLNGNIKLFGSTINANPSVVLDGVDVQHRIDKNPRLSWAHVQSYIFSMNITTLCYLIDNGIFSNTNYAQTFQEAIWQREVRMSRLIIDKGWNIGSMLKRYRGVDFTFHDKTAFDYDINIVGDVMWENYENKLWNKYDLVFVKGNKGWNDNLPILK